MSRWFLKIDSCAEAPRMGDCIGSGIVELSHDEIHLSGRVIQGGDA